jgi:dipeptidyl aminopeptidase/acylaminoacyl peptidase
LIWLLFKEYPVIAVAGYSYIKKHELNSSQMSLFCKKFIKSSMILCLVGGFVWNAFSQGLKEDYLRAEQVKESFSKVYNSPSSFSWTKEGDFFWYSKATPLGNEFWKFEVNTGNKSRLFENKVLVSALNSFEGIEVKEDNLGISIVEYDIDENLVKFRFEGYEWDFIPDTGELLKKEKINNATRRYWGQSTDDKDGDPVLSPDKSLSAYIKDHNLYLKDGEEEKQLSFDGSPGEYYAVDIKWSPDGKKIALTKIRPAEVRKLYLLESTPKEQLQPKLHERDYRKPGDALPIKIPVIVNLEMDKVHFFPLELIPDQYSVHRLEWRENSQSITFEYNQRGHQEYAVYSMYSDGRIKNLIKEESPTFIDYSGKYYRKDLNNGSEIIWSSERDGFRHLYLYDGKEGRVINQITKGEWVVREVLEVNEETRSVLFLASGMNSQEDPYHTHFCRINLDGSDFEVLTKEDANYSISLSPDRSHFIATYSRQDRPPVSKVYSLGKKVNELHTVEIADISAIEEAGWTAPEIFHTTGRDGKSDIWGLIIKPSNFDPLKKYPVIEYIYAGPHSSHVPKSFRPNYSGLNELAELGFIVVQIDGMGTSNRSKAFHDVCYQDLKDAGFPDRKIWITEAARSRPYMDIDRVGIFGTSAGGQNAAGALVFHNDFYKVAVSSCGCHDNRMDKIWWNEQWMGKIGPHYEACSNTVNADLLEGKLLLIVGELDDNVDPASTYQFADALIKEMKDFEFIMVPGMGHSSGGSYGERKRRDFFVRNLLGSEPPAWN